MKFKDIYCELKKSQQNTMGDNSAEYCDDYMASDKWTNK